MDKHELICKLKELALELGRVPVKREFTQRYGHKYETPFGTFGLFKQAAGFSDPNPQKIDNSIFEVPVEKHLEEYKPPTYIAPNGYPTALIISDTHWPFVNQRVVDKFIERAALKKPEWVILNGDAWDMYSHTKFPRSHNIFTPRDERKVCLEKNADFWRQVQTASPSSRCVQLLGNHDIRPMKKILESYPEAEDWVREALERDFSFSGVQTIFDSRQELFLSDKVIVFHGFRTQLGSHRDYTLLNCINGHSHTGGVVFRQLRTETLFELNSGFAGDPLAKGLTYTPQKITNWTPGFGELDVDGPRFIPC